jgi:WXG100 family type VII secretion target
MAGVHVSHDDMNAQAQRLGLAKNELEGKLQEVQSQIQNLVSSGFITDSSSASFAEAHERWNTAAKATISELEMMATYLGKASAAFADVDKQFTVKI